MKKLGIIAIGYNRKHSLKRLLEGLDKANYENDSIDLIISIDFSEKHDVCDLANEFSWSHGRKFVECQSENLGLRRHILKCGSYIMKYGFDAIAVFEDDVYPAPGFYLFMKEAVEFYFDDENVAGISLYSHMWNSQAGLPFIPLKKGYDIYFMSIAQSWGQIWTRPAWERFNEWYEKNSELELPESVPENMREWPDSSWLKYHTAYCIENNKFFVYPYNSLTTCFADIGVHTKTHHNLYQVPVELGTNSNYSFVNTKNGEIFYDAFFEPMFLGSYLGIEESDLCTNLYNQKKLFKCKYLLSAQDYPYRIVRSFGLECRPHEMNVICNIPGKQIKLYDTSVLEDNHDCDYGDEIKYYFRFNKSVKWLIKKRWKLAIQQKIENIKRKKKF